MILHRLRSWWRDRPRGAILAFFDIKPIAVKAYGGRCYTTNKRLVLQRNQKTRGRFYLYLLYEVSVVIAFVIERRRRARKDAEELAATV